jgi:hypothetical protein
MHKSYKERNMAALRQSRIIDQCMSHNVKILIHDQDHKMLTVQAKALASSPNVTMASPELKPRKDFERLMYPNPYEIRNHMINRMPFFGEWQSVYIGNNYERWDQWVEYVAKPAGLGIKTKCFGNWLLPHPDRQTPKEVKAIAPTILFPGRLSQRMIVETYLEFDITVHLAKPSYNKSGFITMRWAEAAAAGTCGFVPREFKHLPEELQIAYVKDGDELFTRYSFMSEDDWRKVVEAQQQWVRKNMTLEGWDMMIEKAVSK